MSKYFWLFITTLYLILVTFIVDATTAETTYSVGSGVPSALSSVDENTLAQVWGLLKTYFNLLFFNVENFPVALSLIFFHPLALANGVLLLDVVKDLVPFT